MLLDASQEHGRVAEDALQQHGKVVEDASQQHARVAGDKEGTREMVDVKKVSADNVNKNRFIDTNAANEWLELQLAPI